MKKLILSFTLIMITLALYVQTSNYQKNNEDMTENKEKTPLYDYTEKEWNKVSAYIEQQYGEYENVMHEIVSPDIHCDIVIVEPTEDQPYYKLITMGAGAYQMNVPKSLKGEVYDRAEYVIFLPKDWNIESDDEEFYWPIGMLKTIARLPIYLENWLGSGHTAQYEDHVPFSETAGYNSCVLLPSIGMGKKHVKPLKLGFWGKKIAFYQIFPLYQEELDFKLAHSLDELLDKMDMGDNYTDENLIIDIHRKNSCK
jgi:hypothetical protein